MDDGELGGNFVVAVEELGLTGLWTTVRELLESRLPLQGLMLTNKFGTVSQIAQLPITYVPSTDKRLQRLKPFSHSPVTWFRNPYAHAILVSTADLVEYKSSVKAAIRRAAAEVERDWGGPAVPGEWLLLYVRPFELDPGDKGAAKVFAKMRDDFGSRRRERCVRIDVPLRTFEPTTGRRAAIIGLEDWDAALRDAIRAAFEARQAAYNAEVCKLLNERALPGWSFTTLYLVKDSFALMLEGGGLVEDAFREYVELETCYIDTLERAAAAVAAGQTPPAGTSEFGGGNEGDDAAALLTSSWRAMRRLVLKRNGVPEFAFRQYLFAAQARVLLRLGRVVDVAERGLVFVQNFLSLLRERQERDAETGGGLRPLFKECWVFSACIALIVATTSYVARRSSLPPDWEVAELVSAANSQPPAVAAMLRAAATPAPGGRPTVAPPCTLPPEAWELGLPASESDTGGAGDVALDLGSLCGQAITPGSLSMLQAGGEQQPSGELLDKLFNCCLGHLYHLARGELLTLGVAVGIVRSEHAASGHLGRPFGAPPPPSPSYAQPGVAGKAAGGSACTGQELGGSGGSGVMGLGLSPSVLSSLGPALVSHLAELAGTPLCGYSRLVAKLPDGCTPELAYEVHTPRRGTPSTPLGPGDDPLAAALASPVSLSVPQQSVLHAVTAAAASCVQQQQQQAGRGTVPANSSRPLSLVERLRRGSSGGTISSVGGAPLSAQLTPSVALGGQRGGKSSGDVEFVPLATGSGGGSSGPVEEGQLDDDEGKHEAVTEADGWEREPEQLALCPDSNVTTPVTTSAPQHTSAPAAARGGAASPAAEVISTTASSESTLAASLLEPHQNSASALPVVGAPMPVSVPRPSPRQVEGILESVAPPADPGDPGVLKGQHAHRTAGDLEATAEPPSSAVPPHSWRFEAVAPASGMDIPAPGAQRQRHAPPPITAPSGSTAPTGGARTVLQRCSGAAPVRMCAPPPWVSEWRLRLALNSPGCLESLVLALSRLAAACYARGGRLRTSALVCADMAGMALQHARLGAACSLLERSVSIPSAEGWHRLAGTLLPKLIACQRLVGHPLLPFSCMRLLALPPGAADPSDRQAAFEELMACVAPTTAMQAAATVPALGQSSAPTVARSAAEHAAAPPHAAPDGAVVQLQAQGAIMVLPADNSYSCFWGSERPGGGPVLVPCPGWHAPQPHAGAAVATSIPGMLPTAGPPPARLAGAVLLCVGDTLEVAVDVYSALPQPLALSSLALTLGRLVTIRGGASPKTDSSSLSGGGAAWAPRRSIVGGSSGATLHADSPLSAAAGDVLLWQEGEDLVAHSLLRAEPLPALRLGSSESNGSTAAGSAPSNPPAGTDSWGLSQGIKLRLPSAGVLLSPGVTRCVFLLSPLVEGLYCLKHVTGLMGPGFELRATLPTPEQLAALRSAVPRDDVWASAAAVLAASCSNPPGLAAGMVGGALPGADARLGSCTDTGAVAGQVVLAHVVAPQQRVDVVAVTPMTASCMGASALPGNTALLAGQPQWVGLLLAPHRSIALRNARLTLRPRRFLALASTGAPGQGDQSSADSVVSLAVSGQAASASAPSGRASTSGSCSCAPGGSLLARPRRSEAQRASASGDAPPAAGAISEGDGENKLDVARTPDGSAVASISCGTNQQHYQQWAYLETLSTCPAPPSRQSAPNRPRVGAAAPPQAHGCGDCAGEHPNAQPGGSWAGLWVPLVRGTLELETLSRSGPFIAWLCLIAGQASLQTRTIPIAQPGPNGRLHLHYCQLGSSSTPACAGGTATAAAGDGSIKEAGVGAAASAELEMELEYCTGCWRTHSRVLSLPLQQPLMVQCAAALLPGARVALVVHVRCMAQVPVVMRDVQVSPQCGLALQVMPDMCSRSMPLTLLPGSASSWTFVLNRVFGRESGVGMLEEQSVTGLMLTYSLAAHSAANRPAVVAPQAAVTVSSDAEPAPPNSRASLAVSHTGEALVELVGGQALLVPPPPLPGPRGGLLAQAPPHSSRTAEEGPWSTLHYPLSLELTEEPSAHAEVLIRLLGPLTGHVGDPLALSWQLVRIAPDTRFGGSPIQCSVDGRPRAAASHGARAALAPPGQGRQGPMEQHSTNSWGSGAPLDVHVGEGQQDRAGITLAAEEGPGDQEALEYEEEVLFYEVCAPASAMLPASGSLKVEAATSSTTGERDSHAQVLASGWASSSFSRGSVRLGRRRGAVAYVEAIVLPTVRGPITAPELRLRGVSVRLEQCTHGDGSVFSTAMPGNGSALDHNVIMITT